MTTRPRLQLDAEPPIAYHRQLARMFGLDGAVFLQQLYYWSDKGAREDGYIFKTQKEFEAETCITPKVQRRLVNELKQLGLLKTALYKIKGAPTLHYYLDVLALQSHILEYAQRAQCNMPNGHNEGTETENTTENTRYNTAKTKKQKTETKNETPSAVAPGGATDDGDGTFSTPPTLEVVTAEVTESSRRTPDPIAETIKLFRNLNPSVYKLYANKTQRQAVQNLLDHHGAGKVINAVWFAESIAAEQYAPVITTPLQLESKWGALQAYYLKKQGKNNQITGKNYDE